MENPEKPVRVATAGEALVDLVRRPDGLLAGCPGGSVYNFTRALALQGVATAYLNPLSSDPYGRQLAQGLADAGVVLGQPEPVREPTSLAVVNVDAQGQPAYSFYRDGVADRATSAQALMRATLAHPGLQAVCTGCLALAPQDRARTLPWLRACRERGLAVVVDANLRPSAMDDLAAWRESVRAALGEADLIKASDEDLRVLEPAIDDPLQAALSLFGRGPARAIALTLGAQGALLLLADGRRWHARETRALRIRDTVGAGDSFLAGLVAGWLDGVDREPLDALADADRARRALARAVASASHCVQHEGCVPPDARALGQALARGSVAVEQA